MRRRIVLLVTIGLAACSDATSPITNETVAFTQTSVAPTPASATITGAGDSIVAVITQPATCGYSTTANAATIHDSLVVTVLLASAGGVPACLALNASTVYRVAVHTLASASYDVVAHYRVVVGTNVSDSIVAQRVVGLP